MHMSIDRSVPSWVRAALVERPRPEAGKRIERTRPVITLSREAGSGGRTVARLLSERLDLEVVGYRVIDEVAHDRGLLQRMAEVMDERAPNPLELLIEGMIQGKSLDVDDYANAAARIVRKLAERGGAVFLGRGYTFILREEADLHVRLVGDPAKRAVRLAEYEGLGKEEARKRLAELDRERAKYIRRVYKADINDPHHYDLTFDTDRVLPEMAVEVIVTALEVRGALAARRGGN